MSKTRKREVVQVRQIIMATSYNRYKAVNQTSLSKTGEYFGTDHSMVIYAKDTVRDLFETSREYREMYSEFMQRIKEL